MSPVGDLDDDSRMRSTISTSGTDSSIPRFRRTRIGCWTGRSTISYCGVRIINNQKAKQKRNRSGARQKNLCAVGNSAPDRRRSAVRRTLASEVPFELRERKSPAATQRSPALKLSSYLPQALTSKLCGSKSELKQTTLELHLDFVLMVQP